MKTVPSVIAILLIGTVAVLAEDGPLKAQTKCPIMGGAIDKTLYADVQCQRIYVCCEACIAVVKQDPDKAFAALQANGERAESLQKTCPVMNGVVDPKLYVEYQGRRIHGCCDGCLRPLRKHPAKYAKKISPKEPAGAIRKEEAHVGAER